MSGSARSGFANDLCRPVLATPIVTAAIPEASIPEASIPEREIFQLLFTCGKLTHYAYPPDPDPACARDQL